MKSNNNSLLNAFFRIPWLLPGIGIIVMIAAFVLAPGFFPNRRDVSQKFVLYIERLEPAGKLVVLTSRQRFVASREFTATLLAIVRLKASIDLSVMADVSYYVELSRPELWSASWNRATRTLTLNLPAPAVLPPAVLTETIEIHEHGANLLTNSVFRLKEEAKKMLSSLSSEIAKNAADALRDSRIKNEIDGSIQKFAASFCRSAIRVNPEHVVIVYR